MPHVGRQNIETIVGRHYMA